jgi:heme A synthase
VGVAVLPKRLAITILAGAAIGAGQATLGQGVALVTLYVLTATGLIWSTLLIYLLGGQPARDRLDQARAWVMANAGILAFVVTLLFGVLFSGQAIVELVA